MKTRSDLVTLESQVTPNGRGPRGVEKVLFWFRVRAGMSVEEFRRYWLEAHAPLARASFAGLRSYQLNIVTGTLEGEPFVNGLAELYWDSREAFQQDIISPAGKRVLDDFPNFASEGGALLAEEIALDAPSASLPARIRRFCQALRTEIRRIPEYQDQADRLARMLRRDHRPS